MFTSLIVSLALLAGGYLAAKPFLSGQDHQAIAEVTQPFLNTGEEQSDASLEAAASHFTCDGREYCTDMRSFEEAKYFLANCPNTKMDGDGDGDGIPCEAQFGK